MLDTICSPEQRNDILYITDERLQPLQRPHAQASCAS